MQAVLQFPEINPNAFSFEVFGFELALRWYALAYIVGIVIGWRMAVYLVRRRRFWPAGVAPFTTDQLEDFLTYLILGIIIGGRLGIVLFYNPSYYFANPIEIVQIWEGGMAFHGGLLGVIAVGWWYTGRHKIHQLSAADLMAIGTPAALFLGRVANFINAELYGRPSDVAWAMKFPTMCRNPQTQPCEVVGDWFYYGNEVARHPSQLYEAALEGLLLGLVLWILATRRQAFLRPGLICGLFFAGYGVGRFIVEFFREADAQFMSPDNPMGYVVGTAEFGITQGQLLCLPMIAIGLALIVYAMRAKREAPAPA